MHYWPVWDVSTSTLLFPQRDKHKHSNSSPGLYPHQGPSRDEGNFLSVLLRAEPVYTFSMMALFINDHSRREGHLTSSQARHYPQPAPPQHRQKLLPAPLPALISCEFFGRWSLPVPCRRYIWVIHCLPVPCRLWQLLYMSNTLSPCPVPTLAIVIYE
jgi:hypothetical protein